jgi:hypothetical protein
MTIHGVFNNLSITEDLAYNPDMERKIFWLAFIVLGLIADVVLPLWWALVATIPIVFISWWVAYRSGWFE